MEHQMEIQLETYGIMITASKALDQDVSENTNGGRKKIPSMYKKILFTINSVLKEKKDLIQRPIPKPTVSWSLDWNAKDYTMHLYRSRRMVVALWVCTRQIIQSSNLELETHEQLQNTSQIITTNQYKPPNRWFRHKKVVRIQYCHALEQKKNYSAP